MSLPEPFSYVDHICFKPKVRTHDLISNQENAACILRIIPGHLLSRCSKGLEEASCSFPPLVSSVSAVRGVNSDGVLQAHISCQPPRSRRQVQIEEAISGTTEADPWQNYELHFSYNTLPSFRREPFFYLTPLPLTHFPWLPLKPLISSIPLITALYWGPLLPDKEGVPYVLDSSSHCCSFWTALDTCQCSRELASWSFPDLLLISWWDNAG